MFYSTKHETRQPLKVKVKIKQLNNCYSDPK